MLLIALLAIVVVGITGWGMLFITYSNLPGAALRATLAVALGLGTLAAFVFLKNRRRTLLAVIGVWALLLVWFFSKSPSNTGDWKPEVSVLATATVDGDRVTIRNIRNLDYRTETDFTPRYYDKTFDLGKLESVDLICVHWGSEAIAHIMMSFGFGGDEFVTFSIETRMQKGQQFSTLAGFFRNYPLTCVVADERDVIRVRTNYRIPPEQTYVFRTRLPVENQRKLFLSYVETVNTLAQQPAWYNTLQDNCATGAFRQTRAYLGRGRFNWKILASGRTGEYAYDLEMLDTSIPFAELRARSLVNDKAMAADKAGDFSRLIRQGAPSPTPMSMEEFTPK